MGIELYLQGYRHAAPDGLPPASVRAIFGVTEDECDAHGFYPLHYGAGDESNLSITARNDLATCVTIHRPCFHPDETAAVFAMLKTGPYVAFAPGGAAPVIAQPGLAGHLPRDMIDALGEPVTISRAIALRPALFPD